MTDQELVARAFSMHRFSYAPYSRFPVGAALLCRDGTVFTGCNVENASYGLTLCAERCAIFAAVKEGVREFAALCVTADTPGPVSPCGACRQVMAEFRIPRIYLTNIQGQYRSATVADLLPDDFSL